MAYFQRDRFHEVQSFAVWGYGALGLALILDQAVLVRPLTNQPGGLLAKMSILLVFALIFNLLCQRTTVSDAELTVTFGALLPLYRRRIALREIASAEAVTYSPLAEYGGWGIRGWGRNVALNARGNRGVRLTLLDGRRILVGSQRPQELAEALAAPC